MIKLHGEEWDRCCPVCGGKCEYGSEICADEAEVWYCTDERCQATVDVPIEIVRYANVTASMSVATQSGEKERVEVSR